MPLPDTQYDSGVAYSFMVKIDGVQIPLPGRPKPGEFTITRGMTDSKTASTWLKSVGEGDLKGARKTAEVAVLDYTGSPIRRYSFTNVWVKSVKCGGLQAGGTNPLTEEISVCYDEMTAE
jgi:phage tail-like protein